MNSAHDAGIGSRWNRRWMDEKVRWMRWPAMFAVVFLGIAALACLSSVAEAKPAVIRYTVRRGDTLTAIAAQHGVSVSSIVRWNALQKDARLTPGKKLGIPLPTGHASRAGAKAALPSAPAEHSTARGSGQTWRDFVRTPAQPGWVSLRSYTRSFAGNALDGGAERRIAEVMAPPNRDAPPIDARLIQLIALVSDTFGGRQILVVSGYRPGGRSRHATAQAIDLSIDGVPNWAVRDFLLTLERVGVGYYPNSNHVHLDVRERSASWVDLSRPGRRARYLRPKRAPKRR